MEEDYMKRENREGNECHFNMVGRKDISELLCSR
jgi:hypothetical protein